MFRFAVRRGYLPKDFEHVEATERRRARGGTIAIYTPDEILPLLALECGNSPSMIFKHYRELVRPVEAVKWFAIKPSETRQ